MSLEAKKDLKPEELVPQLSSVTQNKRDLNSIEKELHRQKVMKIQAEARDAEQKSFDEKLIN